MTKSLQSEHATAAPAATSAAPQELAPVAGAEHGNAAAQEAMKKQLGGGEYTIQPGDTLWGIAKATYGDGGKWAEIQKSNPTKVKQNGNLIIAGEVLTLPVLDDGKDPAAPIGGQTPAVGPDLRTTDFGVFSVYPDNFQGPLPTTKDAIQVVREATFLQYQAEAQTEVINPDIDVLDSDVSFARTVVTIGSEQVAVTSKAEAQHAQRILKTIREVYGVTVDSQAGVDAIKAQYTNVPQAELDKLKTKEWEYKELAALERALSHFAPILGDARADSTEGATQPITTASKVDQAIDSNSAGGLLDTTTLGEYFAGSTNFSMFSAGTDSAVDFADSDKQLEGTAVHEIAHGLLKPKLGEFVTNTEFWTDKSTPSGKAGAEAPPTDYGKKNASEDLSESAMMYFVDGATFRTTCPERAAWLDATVAGWKKPAPAAPAP